MNTKILFVTVGILSVTLLVRSQGTLAWQFDTTAFVVQPNQEILLTGTVTNSSDEPYLIHGNGGGFSGSLQSYYEFLPQLDIYGKTIPAYGTLQFYIGSLTPIGGFVQPGIYVADPVSNPATINFAGTQNIEDLIYSQNGFQITVVPEPSVICVGGLGLALFLISGLKERRLRINK